MKKQIMKNILGLIMIIVIGCQNHTKPIKNENNTDSASVSQDSLWDTFILEYHPLSIKKVKVVDSLYESEFSERMNKFIPVHLVKRFLPFTPLNIQGYVQPGYRVDLSDSLIGLISVFQGDTIIFNIDVFKHNTEHILSIPLNKFYGISLTSYAYRTEVILKNDSLYLNREIRQITDPEYYRFIDKDIYLGQYCLRKSNFDLKTKKEHVTFEDCRNTKLKQVMNISLGLVETN